MAAHLVTIMLGALWYFLELVLAKNILEALGYNWVLYFVIALVVVFLRLLASGLPDDDYRIIYRP